MVCPLRFDAVELYRTTEYPSCGVLADYVTVAKNLALRDGKQKYYGYINTVTKDSWSGGIIGIKTMLHAKSRQEAFSRLEKLFEYGYAGNAYNPETKELFVWSIPQINREIKEYIPQGQCFSTNHCGYILLDRTLGDRLVAKNYVFTEGDAFIDLMLHTVVGERTNPFSYLAPVVMYNKDCVLTLDTLGSRWNWEKTKVHRFFKKHSSVFSLRKCPGNFGCVIFNFCQTEICNIPSQSDVNQLVSLCLYYGRKMKRKTKGTNTINNIIKRNASCIISYIYHHKNTRLYHLLSSFYFPIRDGDNAIRSAYDTNIKKPLNYFDIYESAPYQDQTIITTLFYKENENEQVVQRQYDLKHFDYLVQNFFKMFGKPPD